MKELSALPPRRNDDGNCEDGNIQWCIDNSIREELDVEALAVAKALLTIDVGRRYDFYEANWEWVPKEPL